MKAKLYILVLIGFISVSVFAQKKNSMIFQEYENQVFINSWRITEFKSAQGVLLKEIWEDWNITGNKWDETSILTSTLNADGTVKEDLTKIWDKVLGKWEETSKTEYIYSSKKVITETEKINMGGVWMMSSKLTNTWSGDLLQSELNQRFDFMTQALVNDYKNTYTYNADNLQTQDLEEKWNASASKWENYNRISTTYSSKNPILIIDEEYKNGSWVNDWKTTNTYNADGSLKEVLEQEWLDNVWKDDSKLIYSYNTNKTIKEVLVQEWKPTNVWEITGKVLFSEEATTSAKNIDLSTEIVVYPNPTKGQISIKSEIPINSIEVLTINGQKIISQNEHSNSGSINLNSYKSGIYILKVNSENYSKTFSILLQK